MSDEITTDADDVEAHGPLGHGPSGNGPTGNSPWGNAPEAEATDDEPDVEAHGPLGHGPSGMGPTGNGPSGMGPTCNWRRRREVLEEARETGPLLLRACAYWPSVRASWSRSSNPASRCSSSR